MKKESRMIPLVMIPLVLGLFDGGGAGASGGAGAAGGAAGAADSAAGGAGAAAPAGQEASAPENAEKDAEKARRVEFREMITGKFKDLYTEEMQRVISKRFKDVKQLEARLESHKPLMELLMQRHGITDGDMTKLYNAVADADPTLEKRAEDNGMTVEQQRDRDRLERELNRLRKAEQARLGMERARQTAERWQQEAAEMQKLYPDFDLHEEVKNPDFLRLLRHGLPMQNAYVALHADTILRGVQEQAAAGAEKRVVDDIRTRGLRPRENGAAAQGAFVTRIDPSTFTKEDRAKIRERALRGERIVF